jgi:colicin import membrane protein
MSTTHDTSVLFSINQLVNDYETRLLEEQAEAARKAEAEEKARLDAERQAKEEEARKAHEANMRKIAEEGAKREEAARLEAIRLATIERARIEAEKQAQIEMQAKAREHELALEALKADEKKKKLERSIRLGAAAGVVLVSAMLGLYFGKIKPEHEASLAARAADINEQFEEKRKLEAQVAANNKRITQAEILLEQSKNAAAAAQAAPTASAKVAPNGTNTIKTPKKTGSCLPGEPGCDFNGNRIF